MSYTRNFKGDNNLQRPAPRNLLIVLLELSMLEIFESKQRVDRISPPKDHYEKIIHCLHLLDGAGHRLVRAVAYDAADHKCASSDSDCLPDFHT